MDKQKKDKYAIVYLEGGHGKQVMSTAFIRALKKQHPDYKIIVVTPWDGPFFYNPDIYRFYAFNEPRYFYDDFFNEDTKIFRQEVYHTESYLKQKKHLTESWCDMYDIKHDGIQPKIYLNPRELEIAKDKIKPDNRPIFLLQTNGGGQGQYSKKSWARDLPVELAQQITNYYHSKGYRILHIRREDQPALQNVEVLNLPFRELYAVFPLSKKRLFIDSFSQHIAAALDLKSVVCWIANKPEVFGYDNNINILPKANNINEMNKYSILEQFDITGMVQQFPYDNINLFDINEIIKAVDSL